MDYLKKFVTTLTPSLPIVRADDEDAEDVIDPQTVLRESCGSHKECVTMKTKYDECNKRVNAKTKTTETCVEELFDFLHCIDHCVTHSLFSKLK